MPTQSRCACVRWQFREQALGPDHPAVARSLENLGSLYSDRGRHGDAVALYQRAITILERAHGPDYADIARELNNIAEIYCKQGRYGEAEPLSKRALAISEQALRSPSITTSHYMLMGLANVYRYQGRFAEAKRLLEHALEICENALGSNHPDVAQSLHDLGLTLRDEARCEEAQSFLSRALAIRMSERWDPIIR